MSTPQELAPILAARLKFLSDARNTEEILEYNQGMTIFTKIYGTNPNPDNLKFRPPLPQIESVDTDLVVKLESNSVTDDTQWLKIYSYKTYIPPPINPPSVNLPTLVVEPFGVGYPNYFELAPDSPSVTPGTSVTINGIKYTKENIGQSPFSPTGFITAWKQQ